MTISEFVGLESRIPSEEAHRQMQAAESALYPHLGAENAQKMWQAWSNAAWRVEVEQRLPRGGSLFSLNGMAVSFEGLRSGLAGAIGGGLAA